ncbi:MAG: DUF29 domain-containing protein [Methylococcales bacterium]
MTADLHEKDFYAWVRHQSQLLKQGQFSDLDIVHLIAEIEDMGGTLHRQLGSRLEVLLMHLLKWHHQPNLRGKSWQLTIAEQRRRIGKLLRKNPSLRIELDAALVDSYEDARFSAMLETGLDIAVFPESCPFSLAEVLDPDYLPA